MRVTVEVTRRPVIADPEGTTIKRALHDLGHQAVADVRVDKVFHLEVEGEDAAEIERQVDEMCRRVLANPVLEDFRITVEGA